MVNCKNHIVEVTGGLSAHIQASLLQTAGALSRPFGFRGVQRCAWLFNRCFSRKNSAVVGLARGGTLSIHMGDGFWAHLLTPSFSYEPEIDFVLSKALQQD